MAEALHIDRDRLLLSPPDRQVPERFWEMVERRKSGRAGRLYHRPPGLLEHRASRRTRACSFRGRIREVLIASAIEHFEGTPGPKRILDLGTGPGTLLLAALDIWPEATGLGIDVSRQALSYASANARRLGFEARVKLMHGNWAQGIVETFDLILCNPPYVADGAELGAGRCANIEPDEALFAGAKGLDAYRELAPQLPRLLQSGGLAAIEIGQTKPPPSPTLLARDGLHATRRARPRRSRPRGAVNLGLRENRLASGCRAHYISGLGRARSPTKAAERIPSQPPTQSAVRSGALERRPEREGQEPRPWRAALPA